MSALEELAKYTAYRLEEGKVILCPTDTLWGLSADATNEEAVNKIFELKNRPKEKSFVILVADEDMLSNYVHEVPSEVADFLNNTTKPTTIIYPKAKNLPQSVCAKNGSIAIRIVNQMFCKKVIEQLGKPIVSTSANYSGEPTPQTFDEISEQLKNSVDFVVPKASESSAKSKASSILKVTESGFETIRA
ncbi:MAG: L-threonylcarbamoyladenylate synthase [Chitinophagales bacterium]